MSRPRVNVTGAIPERVLQALAAEFELADAPESVDGVLSLILTKVDDAFLERAGPRLRIVANYGVGVDNIDLAAARARGIVVANTPDVLTRATAELAIALTLRCCAGSRRATGSSARREPWAFSLEFMLGESLDGKSRRDRRARPHRPRDRTPRRSARSDGELRPGAATTAPPLLAAADVVSLHSPRGPDNRHLIDAEALGAMKPTAVLVNTARGPVVDEAALVDALRSRRIAGAALDVFEFEPEVSAELLELENVVLTPHLGSATRETREAMGLLAVSALRSLLIDGIVPPNVVA